MYKQVIATLALLFTSLFTMAEPITQGQALVKARKFFANHGITMTAKAEILRAPGMPSVADSSKVPYYVFNAGKGKGYAIISGDDRTAPVLGYSLSGALSEDDMPCNMKAWLQEYARQIKYMQDNDITANETDTEVTDRATIDPMLTTDWNQGGPYNNSCPTHNGSHCYTGCVATAMAQVLYYQYQQHQTTMATATLADIVAYNTPTNNLSVPVIASGSPIDWKNMLPYYIGNESSTQQDAVANLMYYCGASVQMDYTRTGSGASSYSVPESFINYFGLDPSTRIIGRNAEYTNKEWNEIIYNELSHKRVVYYSGISKANSGHAFVIDGYEGNNYFHVNWGWGGTDNGAYLLSLLAPPSGGTGAGIISDGYNYSQQAVINAEPNHGGNASVPLIIDNFTISNTQVRFSVYNISSNTITYDCGIGEIDDNGNIVPLDSNLNISSDKYYGVTAEYELSIIPNGTYYIVPIARYTSNGNWMPLWVGHTLTVTIDEGKVVIDETPKPSLQLNGRMALSYQPATNIPCRWNVSIANEGGDDFNGPLYFFASKTTDKGKAVDTPSFGVIAGGQNTLTNSWTPESAGIYNLWLCTNEDGTGVIDSITNVEVLQGRTITKNLDLTISNLKVDNAIESSQTLDSDHRLATRVNDDCITGTFTATFNEDGANLGQTTDLLKINDDGSIRQIYGIYNWGYYNNFSVPKGVSVSLEFSFKNLEDGKYALLISFGSINSGLMTTTYYANDCYAFVIGDNTPTDISSINNNDKTTKKPVIVYNMQGMKVATMPTSKLNTLPQGIYIVNGKKVTVK